MLFARTIGDSMLRSLVLWGASVYFLGFCGTYVGGAGSSLYNGQVRSRSCGKEHRLR